MTPKQIAEHRRLEGLRLSRARVADQLGSATDPRHRQMLHEALADLDRQIEHLSPK